MVAALKLQEVVNKSIKGYLASLPKHADGQKPYPTMVAQAKSIIEKCAKKYEFQQLGAAIVQWSEAETEPILHGLHPKLDELLRNAHAAVGQNAQTIAAWKKMMGEMLATLEQSLPKKSDTATAEWLALFYGKKKFANFTQLAMSWVTTLASIGRALGFKRSEGSLCEEFAPVRLGGQTTS